MVLRQLTARVESAYAQYQATRYRQDAQENDVLPATREAAALGYPVVLKIASADDVLRHQHLFRMPRFVIARKKTYYWQIREKIFD